MPRLLSFSLILMFAAVLNAEDKKAPQIIDLGNIKLTAPKDWQKKQPKSRIVAYEFAAPAKVNKDSAEKNATATDAKGKKLADGRFTVMRAGGGVKANVERWMGQFSQPDDRKTKDVTKVTEKEFGKTKVHLIDISGTYNDRPRPISPGVKRKDYRMLAAIIPTNAGSGVFLKLYGPKQTIAANEKAFMKMLESLAVGK